MPNQPFELEEHIADWKRELRSKANPLTENETELESLLRGEIDSLLEKGLTPAEAFLIGLRRAGSTSAFSRDYYQAHGRYLWKHLALPEGSVDRKNPNARRVISELTVVIVLVLVSALASQIPYFFGGSYANDISTSWTRQILFLFFPWMAAWMIWKRRLSAPHITASIAALVVGALLINLFPYLKESDTLSLSLLHLGLLYWAAFGLLYASSGKSAVRGYIDFLRFSGELFVYTVLVVLGGAVLLAVANAVFATIGIDISILTEKHLVVAGAFGAPVIGSYLVEAKRGITENIAPVLAKLFIPLFFLVLLAFLFALLITGKSPFLNRSPLIVLDLLLFLVLAMAFFSISSRTEFGTPSITDYTNCALLAVAAVVDAIALSAIIYRLSSWGVSPNRLAALGENVLMLVQLTALSVAYVRYLARRKGFEEIKRWTTRFIPVYVMWFVFVVAVLPPLFGFA